MATNGYLFYWYTPNLASGFQAGGCKPTTEEACSSVGGVHHIGQGSVYCDGIPSNNSYGTLATCNVPVTSSSVSVDWSLQSLDTGTAGFIFGGSLFLWATGLGIGLLMSVVRRTRL